MKRTAFSLWKTAASLCVLGFIALVLYPVFGRRRENERPAFCQSNLKQIALAIQQYNQDYDYAFPPVSHGREGWGDTIQPYLKSRRVFNCPSATTEWNESKSDYFFNSRLSAIAPPKNSKTKIESLWDYISNPSLTIMNGDGESRSTDSAQSSLGSFDQPDSPPRRHLDGANYSFIDGHVKWYKPDNISEVLLMGKELRPTFAIK